MTRIFVTSDLHLNHKNILVFEPSRKKYLKCETIEEHDDALIERINKIVKPNDILYILGDVGFGKTNELKPKIERINGIKILIKGNHDNLSDRAYLYMGFSAVCNSMTIKIGKSFLVMNHYPYRYHWIKSLFFRMMGKKLPRDLHKRPHNHGQWLLHGHTHGIKKLHDKNQIHVGVDAWECNPVMIEKILELIGKKNED